MKFHLPFFILFLFAACQGLSPSDEVARVRKERITVEDLQVFIRGQGEKYGPKVFEESSRFNQLKQQSLEELVRQKIFLQEIRSKNIRLSPQTFAEEIQKYKSRYSEKSFQEMLKQRGIDYAHWQEAIRFKLLMNAWVHQEITPSLQVSPEQIQDYYEQHREEFTQPEAVRVRQIVTETHGAAEAILKKLKQGENFARLAKDLSLAPDRLQGGDVGWVTRGSFPKEFEICFGLKVGEVSEVVASPYGFHLFKVLEKRSEHPLTLSEVGAQVREWLLQEAQAQAVEDFYQKIRIKYPVEVKSWVLKKIKI